MLHTIDRTIVIPGVKALADIKLAKVIGRYQRMLRHRGWRVHTGTMTNLKTGEITHYISADKIVLDCECKPSSDYIVRIRK